MIHIPVLQKEVIEYLNPKPNENFIDATIGSAGHSLAILEKNGPNGKVLGIDRDAEILKNTKYKIQDTKYKNRLLFVCDNFANLKEIVEKYNFGSVNGILFDLGMSSWHIEESGRGFSFQRDEPLDMRYNDVIDFSRSEKKCYQITAEEIVNTWKENKIEEILREYGGERFSKRIAKRICDARKIKPIKTTFQLVEVIRKAFPRRYKFGKIHFATRAFQAIRIAVNDELNSIKRALPQAIEILEPAGKIAIISFHSGEDKIVKDFFKEKKREGILEILTKKPISAFQEEIKINPRSRSARLRVAVKIMKHETYNT